MASWPLANPLAMLFPRSPSSCHAHIHRYPHLVRTPRRSGSSTPHFLSLRACAIPADTIPANTASSAAPTKPAAPTSSAPDQSSSVSAAPFYTGMRDNQLGYWNLYQGMEKVERDLGKGWTYENGEEDPMLVAHLLLIANMAADRAEMHSIIGKQRDNWNKLFQSTLTGITMTATILAAMDGHSKSLSFSLPACIMDAVVAGMMIGINKFQPSQLAEEQRTAARLCKKMSDDIHYTLRISPHLRQDAQAYMEETLSKLLAVDKAYPLPLVPVVLEKFPKKIVAPVISNQPDKETPQIHASGATINGWEAGMSETLAKLCDLMEESDTRDYIRFAKRVQNINQCCAVGAPILAISAALLNAADALELESSVNMGVFAAVCSTLAAFVGSFSHDAQLGMIFELYRSSMGYFGEMEASIQRAIRLPVEKRENGVLFRQRVAYELGRRPEELSEGHKTASTLF